MLGMLDPLSLQTCRRLLVSVAFVALWAAALSPQAVWLGGATLSGGPRRSRRPCPLSPRAALWAEPQPVGRGDGTVGDAPPGAIIDLTDVSEPETGKTSDMRRGVQTFMWSLCRRRQIRIDFIRAKRLLMSIRAGEHSGQPYCRIACS